MLRASLSCLTRAGEGMYYNGMKNESQSQTYVCIIEFGEFDPSGFSALYTRSRLALLDKIALERARMQSAAAELAYLAAARAALLGGMLGAENAAGSADELKKRFEYSYGENGKPILECASMSLSHSSGTAMAAVAQLAVGVDIERKRRVSWRAAKRIMNAKEYEDFISLPDEDKNCRLLEVWTAKESFLKLTGEGIAAGLDKLHYDREKDEVRRETTGECAFAARFDSEALCACSCSFNKAEPKLLRFSCAESAAEFIGS